MVVTRSGGRASGLVDALERAGAVALELPLTRQVEPEDGGAALAAAAAAVRENEWVVLTSVNAVDRFMGALRDARALGSRARWPPSGRPRPTRLRRTGVEPDLVPAEHSARGLVEEFPDAPAGTGTGRVLFPSADLAPETIPDGLGARRAGTSSASTPTARWHGRAPEPALLDRVAAADALTFTATSGVQAFMALRTPEGMPVPVPAPRRLHRADDGRRRPGGRARQRARGLGRLGPGHRRRADRGAGPPPGRRPVGWDDGRRLHCAHAGGFPVRRLRRLRRTPALRRLVAEARLGPDDLVAPLFVREGIAEPVPIASMPGEVQHSLDSLVVEAKRLVSLGVPGLILFGVPERKDAQGSGAWDPRGRRAGRAASRARRRG